MRLGHWNEGMNYIKTDKQSQSTSSESSESLSSMIDRRPEAGSFFYNKYNIGTGTEQVEKR